MNAITPTVVPVLEVAGVVKDFQVPRGIIGGTPTDFVRAAAGVSFLINPGETFGLVG